MKIKEFKKTINEMYELGKKHGIAIGRLEMEIEILDKNNKRLEGKQL